MTPIRDLVSLWEFDATARISPPIIVEYRRYLDRLAAFTGRSLRDATELDLKRYMAHEAAIARPGTLSITRRAVRSFYGWLHSERLIDCEPGPRPPRHPAARNGRPHRRRHDGPCCSPPAAPPETRRSWSFCSAPGCAAPNSTPSPSTTSP